MLQVSRGAPAGQGCSTAGQGGPGLILWGLGAMDGGKLLALHVFACLLLPSPSLPGAPLQRPLLSFFPHAPTQPAGPLPPPPTFRS